MDRSPKRWIAAALSYMLVSVGLSYGELNTDYDKQLQQLQHELSEASAANKAVRSALDDALTEYHNVDAKNEARSQVFTQIIQGVLDDADTRFNHQGGHSMIGWNDGFQMRSADGRFSLTLGGLVESRYFARWQGLRPTGQGEQTYDQWRYSFGQPRTELNFQGHVHDKSLEYYLATGWGRFDPTNLTANGNFMTFRLWEAWLKFRFTQDFSMKMGSFELPFTRESMVRTPYQLAVDKSLLDYRFGLGPTTGVEWTWSSPESRYKFMLSNGSGAFFYYPIWAATDATPPLSALSKDTAYSFTMRKEWKLLGDWEQFNQFTSPPGSERGMLVGLAWHRQNTEPDNPFPISEVNDRQVFWSVTGDVSMQFDGASLFAAFTYTRLTDFTPLVPRINFHAFVLQGSTYVTNQTELFARYETGSGDEPGLGDSELQLFTIGVNHYLDGQDLKFTADIGFSFGEVNAIFANTQTGWHADTSKDDQALLRTQLQFMF
ncbi:MAG: hypothetical protein VX615_00875 [Planctomycetota bacterium]|nr:hypothetical protein [Planctomycetota bacterium]